MKERYINLPPEHWIAALDQYLHSLSMLAHDEHVVDFNVEEGMGAYSVEIKKD